jgi:hypothetical protein
MPFFHNQTRDELRQFYAAAWRKHRERLPLEPLEAQIADVIVLHPEYQSVLEDENALDKDYTPESGQSNPFLHMGLHLAVREQVSTDRPSGIRAAFEACVKKLGSAHDAEHQMIECLAEALWDAQRSGRPPDEMAYLERVRQIAR